MKRFVLSGFEDVAYVSSEHRNQFWVMLPTSDKNGYQLMDVAYHIDLDGCINLSTGWKEFAAESGFEDGDVVMVMFLREDDSLTFRIYVLQV